jgi:hypothetical protein
MEVQMTVEFLFYVMAAGFVALAAVAGMQAGQIRALTEVVANLVRQQQQGGYIK